MEYLPYDKDYVDAKYKHVEETTNRRYRLDNANWPRWRGERKPSCTRSWE